MTDELLLEFAAKASGIYGSYTDSNLGMQCYEGEKTVRYWNPLINDSDVLRLAQRLFISVIYSECRDGAPLVTAKWETIEITLPNFPDGMKATRRAIVIVAAAIGKEM